MYAGENIVISRPDKPPPEVVLIERQPRCRANRVILSAPCSESANQPSRRLSHTGRDVWREETRPLPCLLLFFTWTWRGGAGSYPPTRDGSEERDPSWSWRVLGRWCWCGSDSGSQLNKNKVRFAFWSANPRTFGITSLTSFINIINVFIER